MNYVTVSGGLGNQMFIYAFYYYLSCEKRARLLYRRNSPIIEHERFQLFEIFSLRPIDRQFSFGDHCFAFYWWGIHVFPSSIQKRLLAWLGYQEVNVPENFVFYDYVIRDSEKTIYRGTWQSEQFFLERSSEVKDAFTFHEDRLTRETKAIRDKMRNQNAISVHIRRKDYLSSRYVSGFGNVCNLDYYLKAMDYMNEHVPNPVFYVFSDDLDWCRQVFSTQNFVFVDCNRGKNSWQDMYLMSQCKHNIIANSSFSWWGAYLNRFSERIVIAPRVWWNGIKDDVVPHDWIRL